MPGDPKEKEYRDGADISVIDPHTNDVLQDAIGVLSQERRPSSVDSAELQRKALEKDAIGVSQNSNRSENEKTLGYRQQSLEAAEKELQKQSALKRILDGIYEKIGGPMSIETGTRKKKEAVDEIRRQVELERSTIAVFQEAVLQDSGALEKAWEFAREESERIQRIALGLAVFEVMGQQWFDSYEDKGHMEYSNHIQRIVELYNNGTIHITPEHYRQAEQLYRDVIVSLRDALNDASHNEYSKEKHARGFFSPRSQIAHGLQNSPFLKSY